jgi:hypothetical protein
MSKIKPYIKVVWEDTPENLTQEKIKRVKTYFENKYHTSSVKVVPVAKVLNINTNLSSLDVSDKLLDQQYQKSLIKDFINDNKIDVKWNLIDRLDNKVNAEIVKNNQNSVKYNRWFIKKIDFSNFLSFGENNTIDFTKMDGITVIESSPKNFGGKCLRSDTEIEIEFDENEIIKKIGFLPDELK